MKKTTSILLASLITASLMISAQTVFAQEWGVLVDKNIFQSDHITESLQKNSGEKKDWLAPQTPLMKNTPITNVDGKPFQWKPAQFAPEYSQVGSWAPLQAEPGKENFTLFSF